MAKVTQAIITCDVCGKANDVQTRTFGFDGKEYEIDLCPEDDDDLSNVAAGYVPKARKVASRGGKRRRNGHGQRSPQGARASRTDSQKAKPAPKQAARAGRPDSQKAKPAPKQAPRASRSDSQKAKAAPKQAAKASRPDSEKAKPAPKQEAKASRPDSQTAKPAPKKAARASRPDPRKAKAPPKQAAKANGTRQKKGIYVYGILPADIEVATGVPGVGEDPGSLRVIRSDGLAALVSEVGLPVQLGSPEDLRAHREILDSTAVEVPVLPMRFGTVLTEEGAVTDELLTPRHDEFAAALEKLDGHAEFLVKGRYARDDAGATVTARRQEDTWALRQAMEGICVACVVKEPAHEMDAVHVAFLVAIDEESEVERVIEDLAQEWEGRIEVQLLGPMAAYDFVHADSD